MQVRFGHEALTLKTQEIFIPSGNVWKWYPIKCVRNNIDLIAPTHLELCIFHTFTLGKVCVWRFEDFLRVNFVQKQREESCILCGTVQGWLESLNVLWCELKVMCGSLLLPEQLHIWRAPTSALTDLCLA